MHSVWYWVRSPVVPVHSDCQDVFPHSSYVVPRCPLSSSVLTPHTNSSWYSRPLVNDTCFLSNTNRSSLITKENLLCCPAHAIHAVSKYLILPWHTKRMLKQCILLIIYRHLIDADFCVSTICFSLPSSPPPSGVWILKRSVCVRVWWGVFGVTMPLIKGRRNFYYQQI